MTRRKAKRELDAGRRRFLGMAAIASFALAPGVRLIGSAQSSSPASARANSKVRWGLLIDTNKCSETCQACVSACASYNGWKNEGRPTDPQWIRKVAIRDSETGLARTLPVLCQHCAEPACVEVCPTGASFRRADGIVLVDRHICIGCRYCMMACPFKARSFVHQNLTDQRPQAPRGIGTVEGCTMCVPRIDAGKVPACVEACAREGRGAMTFGDLNDRNSAIRRNIAAYSTTRFRADLDLDPSVQYQGL